MSTAWRLTHLEQTSEQTNAEVMDWGVKVHRRHKPRESFDDRGIVIAYRAGERVRIIVTEGNGGIEAGISLDLDSAKAFSDILRREIEAPKTNPIEAYAASLKK